MNQKASYPIPEEDMFLLFGLIGCLNAPDYAALVSVLQPDTHQAIVTKNSAYAIFWSKLANMNLATCLSTTTDNKENYLLLPDGKDAVTLSQVYLVSGKWPHWNARICPEVIQILEKYVLDGDAAAQTKLGGLYEAGQGVEKDTVRAFSLYQKAAAQSDARGAFLTGSAYLKGDIVARDVDKAAHWLRTAESLGSSDTMLLLFWLHSGNFGFKSDMPRAFTFLDKAVLAGNGDATYILGTLYAGGRGKPRDNLKAFLLLSLALTRWVNSSEEREKVGKSLSPWEIRIANDIFDMASKCKNIPPALL